MAVKHCYYGRLNIGFIKQSDNICIKYNDFLAKYKLKNVIEKPTRNGATFLDHIITNITEKVSNQDVLPCPTINDPDAPLITVNAKVARYEPKY